MMKMGFKLKIEVDFTAKQFDKIIKLMNVAVKDAVKTELNARGLIKK